MDLVIIDSEGWEKRITTDKPIIRIGSAITNDVVLQTDDIAPIHLQIMQTNSVPSTCKLFAFNNGTTILREMQRINVPPATAAELLDKDKIIISAFQIAIYLSKDSSYRKKTEHIEAVLFLSAEKLAPNEPVTGSIKIRNIGEERSCQFALKFFGLPNECVQIEPLPRLYPGAESSIGFIFEHKRTMPAPGFHTLTFQLSAPADYFGEIAVFKKSIFVTPVCQTDITLLDDFVQTDSGKDQTREVVLPKMKDGQSLPTVQLNEAIKNSGESATGAVLRPRLVGEPVQSNNTLSSNLPKEPEKENIALFQQSPHEPISIEKTSAKQSDSLPPPPSEKNLSETVETSVEPSTKKAAVRIADAPDHLEARRSNEKFANLNLNAKTPEDEPIQNAPEQLVQPQNEANAPSSNSRKEEPPVFPIFSRHSGYSLDEEVNATKEKENNAPEKVIRVIRPNARDSWEE